MVKQEHLQCSEPCEGTRRLFLLPRCKEEIEKKLVLKTPDAEISSIWWPLTQFFGLRGSQEGYAMKMEDFKSTSCAFASVLADQQ